VDADGLHARRMQPLPELAVALLNTQISIHRLLVEAYEHKSRNALLQALLLDPTTVSYRAAVALIDLMCDKQADVLPRLELLARFGSWAVASTRLGGRGAARSTSWRARDGSTTGPWEPSTAVGHADSILCMLLQKCRAACSRAILETDGPYCLRIPGGQMARHKSWTAIRTQVEDLRYELQHNNRRQIQYSRSQSRELEVAMYTLEWVLGRHSNTTPLNHIGQPRGS
jgi:hypothetical protein